MEQKTKGGARVGAGRKKTDNPKITISLYVERKKIWLFGNEQKLKDKLYEFINGYEAKLQYVTPVSEQQEIAQYNSTHPNQFTSIESKPKLKRSEAYFLNIIKNGFELPQEHMEFINEVNESDLPERIKTNLITASRVKQS